MQRNKRKNYYDKKLLNKLKTIITEDKYDKFTELVLHIFLRRKYEFDLSDEQIIEEAERFVKNIKEIEFQTKDTLSVDTLGFFDGSNGTIVLNYFALKKRLDSLSGLGPYVDSLVYLKLYETLTHEVYHAISFSLLEHRIGLKNTNTNAGIGLNEIITEVAADRASRDRPIEYLDQGISKTFGYQSLTFISGILTSALGFSEKQLINSGQLGRDELIKLILTRFTEKDSSGANISDTINKQFIDKIILGIDILHNSQQRRKDDYGNLSEDEIMQFRTKTMIELIENIYKLFSYQIENDPRGLSDDLCQEYAFRYKRLEKMVQTFIEANREYCYIGLEHVDQIKNAILDFESRKKLTNQVAGIIDLSNNNLSVRSDRRDMALMLARRGELFNTSLRSEIRLPSKNVVPSVIIQNAKTKRYRDFIISEDYPRKKHWDNTKVLSIAKKIFEREKMARKIVNGFFERTIIPHDNGGQFSGGSAQTMLIEDANQTYDEQNETFISKMINKIKSMISKKNIKKLPEAKEEYMTTENKRNAFELSDDEKREYERRVQEVNRKGKNHQEREEKRDDDLLI